jgi:hypothetical protein
VDLVKNNPSLRAYEGGCLSENNTESKPAKGDKSQGGQFNTKPSTSKKNRNNINKFVSAGDPSPLRNSQNISK